MSYICTKVALLVLQSDCVNKIGFGPAVKCWPILLKVVELLQISKTKIA